MLLLLLCQQIYQKNSAHNLWLGGQHGKLSLRQQHNYHQLQHMVCIYYLVWKIVTKYMYYIVKLKISTQYLVFYWIFWVQVTYWLTLYFMFDFTIYLDIFTWILHVLLKTLHALPGYLIFYLIISYFSLDIPCSTCQEPCSTCHEPCSICQFLPEYIIFYVDILPRYFRLSIFLAVNSKRWSSSQQFIGENS